MATLAAQLPRQKRSQLGPLRIRPDLEIHDAGDELWLRAIHPSEELKSAFISLPSGTVYQVLDDGQLCRFGSLVPKGKLPSGPWERLSGWLAVELPRSALPGQISERLPLKLVRDNRPREANVLLTTMEPWLDYGSTAPQIRLDRWRFAVSTEGEVVIRGVPLPAIPGRRFVEANKIAVPCGWHWSPPVDGDVLAGVLSLSPEIFVLWREDARHERIFEDQFVRATRSAIRRSAEAKPHA
jgi:hypothetical protein